MNSWDWFHRSQYEERRRAFEARPDYADLIAEAAARGYRRITLSEQMDCGRVDAYMWRGGVWVKSVD